LNSSAFYLAVILHSLKVNLERYNNLLALLKLISVVMPKFYFLLVVKLVTLQNPEIVSSKGFIVSTQYFVNRETKKNLIA